MGEGKEEREGKSKAKEKGKGKEKGKKEDSHGDREGKKEIHWCPHVLSHTLFLLTDLDFSVYVHNVF